MKSEFDDNEFEQMSIESMMNDRYMFENGNPEIDKPPHMDDDGVVNALPWNETRRRTNIIDLSLYQKMKLIFGSGKKK